ncbi:hypothetical protein NDA11_004932 [Ustilago hordei]|nr:hypothetical protein NDA11_004932 [Ustilago hordei]KAJ1596654.1 hypothetical protein NDA14_003032 [Ustilago hordei]UTT90101.1 hypothetical protein NDA17_004503 [Ustilago hordei]
MPLQSNDLHTTNDPSLKDSSDDQAKTILAPVDHQRITKHDTASSNSSDSNNSEPNKPLLDLNNINKMNINTLQNIVTQSTLHKQAKTSSYKLPSKCCGFLHEVTQLNDVLKDTPKLTMKNWYAWNPCFWDILALWSLALKHLNSTTKLGDKKYNWKLNAKLHMIIQSNAKLIGQDNMNYLQMQPANAESWRIHELYAQLKKDLTKMEHITESTLLYKARRIHMLNADVHKFLANLDEHWAKAVTAYNNCIMNLQDNSHGTNYDAICVALFKQQDDMVTKPNHRIDSGKTTQAFTVSSQVINQDTYSMGKPGLDG